MINVKQGFLLADEYGVSSLDARILLEYVTKLSRDKLLVSGNLNLSSEQEESFKEMLNRRAKDKVPIAYLTGQKEFWNSSFVVDESCLIPRPDSEILIEVVLKYTERNMQIKILDLCTGSGCLLLSLLQELPNASGVGIDVSVQALEIAKKNTKLLNIERSRVDFECYDLLEDAVMSYLEKEGKFDIIISNPPYIKTSDLQNLIPDIIRHEPISALDGGENGMLFYNRIAEILSQKSGEILTRDALVFLEIDDDEHKTIDKIFTGDHSISIGNFKDLKNFTRVCAYRYLI